MYAMSAISALSRVLPVHAPRSESRFIVDQPFVVGAAYDREEPRLTDAAPSTNACLGDIELH